MDASLVTEHGKRSSTCCKKVDYLGNWGGTYISVEQVGEIRRGLRGPWPQNTSCPDVLLIILSQGK